MSRFKDNKDLLSAMSKLYGIVKSMSDGLASLGGEDEMLRQIESDPDIRKKVMMLLLKKNLYKVEVPPHPVLLPIRKLLLPDDEKLHLELRIHEDRLIQERMFGGSPLKQGTRWFIKIPLAQWSTKGQISYDEIGGITDKLGIGLIDPQLIPHILLSENRFFSDDHQLYIGHTSVIDLEGKTVRLRLENYGEKVKICTEETDRNKALSSIPTNASCLFEIPQELVTF